MPGIVGVSVGTNRILLEQLRKVFGPGSLKDADGNMIICTWQFMPDVNGRFVSPVYYD